ncbi:hypothetical protein PVL29_017707 [Vitis rotundifolia]|uniref:C2 domain-containing protein n=1 Tax=Vitis rotundifolia TaxID=103349 RepID=A0AA39DJE6_VITRO|nr:hypothetical protein PVL29_017707 [Vitis rotundifolia]
MPRPAPNQSSAREDDYSLKETSPNLGGGRVSRGDKLTTAFDLVEQMHYLYVRVVKAKELPGKDGSESCDPYVEVKVGNFKGFTKHIEKKSNPVWSQVFAFSKDRLQSPFIEVSLKDKNGGKDDFMGVVLFDLHDVPRRVPPDSPLAPQWYRLEDRKGSKVKGELMLAVWIGTQADESFTEAWQSDAAGVSVEALASIRAKVYVSPKLWYLRVNVIQAQDLVPSDRTRNEVYVKAALGTIVLRTRFPQTRTINPFWNEDLMFVASEPFEEPLVLSVENRVAANKEETLGKCMISLQGVERRLENRPVSAKWFNLEKMSGEQKEVKFSSRIHLRICLDGGYHVLDEATHFSTDFRPTMKHLWKPSIGVLELGIIDAHDLLLKEKKGGRRNTDAYCVAKYGQKWIRTRTIIDSSSPRWNEQYTWEVFDPCTVITVGVFDNSHLQGGDKAAGSKDTIIGKVRIRLSTLETGRVYTHSYPLLVLDSSGLKKMGEIQLSVKFSCSSLLNLLNVYAQPLLPRMHYVQPLSMYQVDSLRHQATKIVSARLGRAEPPLRKEVVEYMLDVGSNMFSMRRSKANYYRIIEVISDLKMALKWFDEICLWKNPCTTVLIHILFLLLALFPELILPLVFFYLLVIGLWRYRRRLRHPPHMEVKLSLPDTVFPDELEEEFDSFPTSQQAEILKIRYDRVRSVASRIQTLMGDLATQGERLQALLSWRDPRATALCMIFCLTAGILFLFIPFRVFAVLVVLYVLRHPRLRQRMPSVPLSFFKRLPARTDSMF